MSLDPSELLRRLRPDLADAQDRLRSIAGRPLSSRERTLIQLAIAASQRSASGMSRACEEADAFEIEPEALLDAILCGLPLCGEGAIHEAIAFLVERYPELGAEDEPLVSFGALPPEIADEATPRETTLEIPLEEIPESGGKAVRIGERAVVVFRRGDRVHAFDDSCPHQDAPMSGGSIEGDAVVCPWHGWRFDLETGHCDSIPEQPLVVHLTDVRDDLVQITLSD